MFVVKRPLVEDSEVAMRDLGALSEVEIVEPNYRVYVQKSPDDPDIAETWGIRNRQSIDRSGLRGIDGIDVNAEKAWSLQTGSRKVVVAVIDTGVDYKHPDLADNMWINEAEAKGEAEVDDDNNGYVDDIYGYDVFDDDGDPMDEQGHGTHCAGTIGAKANNGIGIAGLNWDVSLMAVKFLNRWGNGTIEGAVKAVDYAQKNGAKILSNSWGWRERSEILRRVMNETRDRGILVVAAAGNMGANSDRGYALYPASYQSDNIISVGAVNNRGNLASFSNYGENLVHITAPGVNIYSTSRDGGYRSISGTSMAVPYVAGVAALLLAQDSKMGYREVRRRILSTARPLWPLKGYITSGGIVDAYAALTNRASALRDPNDPNLWTRRVEHKLESEHPYKNSSEVTYTITIPGAKRFAVHFARFETEYNYDYVSFTNGKGEWLGSYSGVKTGEFGPITDGETINLKLKTDRSYQYHGFEVDYVAVEY